MRRSLFFRGIVRLVGVRNRRGQFVQRVNGDKIRSVRVVVDGQRHRLLVVLLLFFFFFRQW